MRSVICVHERFDAVWPFTSDYWHQRWQEAGCELFRTEEIEARAPGMVPDPHTVQRLVLLGLPADPEDLEPFTALEECYHDAPRQPAGGIDGAIARGVSFISPCGDVQWGQSVAEFALGLTLSALRRIPQTHTAITTGHEAWQYHPGAVGKPGQRGAQFGDDPRFTNGTLAGKRVRVVGVGNIGGRYASWCSSMGADVAVWDPFAPDASFALAGVRRCHRLSELLTDSQIFAPIVPLNDETRGLINAELVNSLPTGSLVVLVTRAAIVDTDCLYRRVINDELALAADVWDKEPVPLDSPLLGRHNVVHTPHNAGRTIDANRARADDAIARFQPR